MSSVKIVLDASALQLLMDKDPEFGVAVNQAALAWIRKSIIKPVTDAKIQDALSACRKELKEHFEKQFKESYAVQKWPHKLSADFKKKVQDIGNDMVESVIKESLQEKINAKNLEAEFRLGVDKLLEDFRNKVASRFTNDSINQLVREVINNKMAVILEKVQG
jgi:YesN/AraC family two-component response regulator